MKVQPVHKICNPEQGYKRSQNVTLKKALEVSSYKELKAVVDEKRVGNASVKNREEDLGKAIKRKVRSKYSDNIEQGKQKLKSNPGGDRHGKTGSTSFGSCEISL